MLASVYSCAQYTRVLAGSAARRSSECQHLRRGSLEQPAAAAGEQRVATEDHRWIERVGEIGDVARSMAGHIEYRERRSQHLDAIASADVDIDAIDVLAAWPVDRGAGGAQRGHAADMVAVVMGD